MAKSTFEATRINGFRFKPEDLVVIGVDTDDGPEHALWDERIKLSLDESMVASIMAIGVKEPIIVRKNGDVAEVVDGRRRVLHAREANKQLKKRGEPEVDVPAMAERGSEDHLAHVSVALNEIRLNDDILVKAAKAHRMMSRVGDAEKVALAFGVTKTSINNWLKLVELAAPVRKAVSEGLISASAASQLHGLDKDEQLAEMGKLLGGEGKATVKKAKAAKKKRADEDGNGIEAPGKRLIFRVLKLNDKAEVLPTDFVRGIEWALGEIGPTSIKGLTALIAEAQEKAAKKKKAAAAE